MNKLFQIAQKAGFTVEYCHIPQNVSISVQDDAGDFVLMDYSLIVSGAKERVHLAHELGHCETGSFYNCHSALDIRQKHENRADKWAIEQLVPKDMLDQAVAEGYINLWELADYFDVSEDFMKKAICWYKFGNLDVEYYM